MSRIISKSNLAVVNEISSSLAGADRCPILMQEAAVGSKDR